MTYSAIVAFLMAFDQMKQDWYHGVYIVIVLSGGCNHAGFICL